MTKQIANFLQILISGIFCVALILIASCSKQTHGPVPGDPDAGGPPSGGPAGNPKIVYTDIIPDSNIVKSRDDSFKLDLNNDGIYDFSFEESITLRCNDDMGHFGYELKLSARPLSDGNAMMTSALNLLPALDSAASISPDSLWATFQSDLITGPTRVNGRCNIQPARGFWRNVSDKYLGLKLIKGESTYYGWVKLTCSFELNSQHQFNGGQLTAKCYAYNNTPNQPILAGQTK